MLHLDVLASDDRVDLCAIAEENGELRADAAVRAGECRAHDDWRSAVADPAIEAVVICLPTGLHAEAAIAAFEAGKHVYVEKPVATSAEESARVEDAWRASGRVGMVGYNLRFDPIAQRLKARVADGSIGHVATACAVMSAAARPLPEWKRSRATGGGAMLDRGSHVTDLVRFLFERPVASVSATIRSVRTDEDTATFTMTLEDGLTVQAQVTLAGILEGRFEVLGDRGRIVADLQRGALEIAPETPPYGRFARASTGLRSIARAAPSIVRPPEPMRSQRAILDAFVGAIAGGSRPAPDIGDGCRSLEIVLAAEEAHRSGRTVEISTVTA